MRMLWLAAIVAASVGAGTGPIQAQQDKQANPKAVAKPTAPTVELRVRSVNDLLDKAEFIGGIAGKEDLIKGVKGLLHVLTREKTGLEGINTKLPFGLYGSIGLDVPNSPIVLMVPIADQDRFLKLLRDRLEIVPEKAEEGTLKAHVPFVEALYLRFANGYLYVGRSVQDLDPKSIADPKTFFAQDDGALASVLVRMGGLPKELKKLVLGQFELYVKEQRKKNGPNEDPALKLFMDWFGDALTDGVNVLFDDARELQVKAIVDEKTQELSVEASLTATPGSALAKNIASLASQPSVSATVASSTEAVVNITAKAGLPTDLKKRFAAIVDDVANELEKNADPNARAVVRQALDALAPTLKAAELDTAISLRGPNAKGRHTIVLATGVKKGKEIEKLLKELSLSAGGVADFDFDVEKIGDFSLHKIILADGPPELMEVFGTRTFWVAISDTCFALSIEPDGSAIRAGLKAKAVNVPAFSLQVSAARLLPLIAPGLKPDEIKALMKDTFGDESPAGKDMVTVMVTGGERLAFKAVVKGKAAQLFVALTQLQQK